MDEAQEKKDGRKLQAWIAVDLVTCAVSAGLALAAAWTAHPWLYTLAVAALLADGFNVWRRIRLWRWRYSPGARARRGSHRPRM